MKLYKIIFNGTEQYIVAASMGDAEDQWAEDPERLEIQAMKLVSDDLMMRDKQT